MTFKEWLKLKEVGTSTACVAAFARPIFSQPVRRNKKGGLADLRVRIESKSELDNLEKAKQAATKLLAKNPQRSYEDHLKDALHDIESGFCPVCGMYDLECECED